MNCAQIRVLVQFSKEILARNLHRFDGLRLKTPLTGRIECVSGTILRYFAHQAHKRLLSNENVYALLYFANFVLLDRSTAMFLSLTSAIFGRFCFLRCFDGELFAIRISPVCFDPVYLFRTIVVTLDREFMVIVQKKFLILI